jgi:peptide deformylase
MTEEIKKAEAINFVSKLVPPHKKKSREITEEDIPRVIAEAHILYNLCYSQVGYIPGCFAVHHSQIDCHDPLNFFVTAEKKVVINPKIIRHTKVPIQMKQGCLSFPNRPPILVDTYNKCEMECSYLTDDGKISEPIILKLSGKDAAVAIHETNHANAIYIYKNYEKQEKNLESGDLKEMQDLQSTDNQPSV